MLHSLGYSAPLSVPLPATNRTDDDEFRKKIAAYDQRMRELLPQIEAAVVGAAALSRDAFDRIDPLIEEVTHFGLRRWYRGGEVL
jgi:hypothetical protein